MRLADRLDSIGRSNSKVEREPTKQVTNESKKAIGSLATSSQALMAKMATAGGITVEPKTPDERFCALFKVANDIVLHTFEAEHTFAFGRGVGSLFLTQKCIAFAAKSFGRQRKLLVPLDAVQKVATSESTDSRLKLVTKTRKRLKFRLKSAEETEQAIALLKGLVANATKSATVDEGDSAASPSPSASPSPHKSKRSSAAADSSVDSAAPSASSSATPSSSSSRKKVKKVKKSKATTALVPTEAEFELADEEVTDDDERESLSLLTRVDWDTILACSSVCSFKTGEYLMREGEEPAGIMQMVRGRASIEKNGKRVAVVSESQILGEISFLRSESATADVIADASDEDDGEVVVQLIPADRLRALFVQQPALAGRTYHHLAMIISDRITDRSTAAAEIEKSD